MEEKISIELNHAEADELFQLLFFREYPKQAVRVIALEDVRGRIEQEINNAGWA